MPPTESLATDTEIMGTTPDNIEGIWKAVTVASPVAAPTYFGDLEQSNSSMYGRSIFRREMYNRHLMMHKKNKKKAKSAEKEVK